MTAASDRRRGTRAMAVGLAVGLAFVAALAVVVIRGHGHLFASAGAAQGLSSGADAGLDPIGSGAPSASPGTPTKPGSGGPGATPTTAANPGPADPGSGSGPGSGGSPGPSGGSGAGPSSGSGSGTTGPVGAGDYRVGVDIAAGSWTTTGPLNVSICTYSINGQPAIQITFLVLGTTIRLAAGDTFRTSGCADWRYAG